MSAALVEACQPTERIRDTNIHRKHSPRYTDVPALANRWSKAEEKLSTKAAGGGGGGGGDREGTQREDTGGSGDYRKPLGPPSSCSCHQTRCKRGMNVKERSETQT